MENKNILDKLKNTYGERLLKYIFAINEVDELPENLEELDKETVELIFKLAQQDNSQIAISLTCLVQYMNEYNTTLLNYLHNKNGGNTDINNRPSNEIVNLFRRLAVDVWPIYLANTTHINNHFPKSFYFSSATFSLIMNHPLTEKICKEFLLDTNLKKLFPESNDTEFNKKEDYFKLSSNWLANSGGGTQSIIGAIEHVIFEAVTRAIIKEKKLDQFSVMKYIESVIEDMRLLANGKSVNMPIIIGFDGLTIEDGVQMVCDDVIIRKPTEHELNLLLDSECVVQCVFETSISTKLEIALNCSEEEFKKAFKELGETWTEEYKDLQKKIDKVRLSLLLASNNNENKLLITNEVCRFLESPCQNGMQTYGRIREYNPYGGCLSNELALQAESWYREIVLDKFYISVKRLLSATSSRQDPSDAFIDAIIVWENLFGTSTETTFRVTGALAKLLEGEDIRKCEELFKELKELYRERSSLVHGNKEITVSDAYKYKNRSIFIAISSLKKLYRERKDLLSLNSEERSRRVLLEEYKNDEQKMSKGMDNYDN